MTTSSNTLIDKEFDDLDLDAPMSSVEDITEEEAANRGISEDDAGQGKPQATVANSSDKEEQLEALEQLLGHSKITAWERGFCGSCSSYLSSAPSTAMLSYKQKAVLVKLVDKYFY